jgi:hypothetical protein
MRKKVTICCTDKFQDPLDLTPDDSSVSLKEALQVFCREKALSRSFVEEEFNIDLDCSVSTEFQKNLILNEHRLLIILLVRDDLEEDSEVSA